MLKTRRILIQVAVKIKNQIHGMLLGYGIETNVAQFQSKRKRQDLINDLADHDYSDGTYNKAWYTGVKNGICSSSTWNDTVIESDR